MIELTARQTEVLGHLLKGKSNLEIAEAVGVSIGSLRHILTRVFRRMKVRSRSEAILKASGVEIKVVSRHVDPGAALTPRQLNVLSRICEGKPNGQIAKELFVSEKAIRWHTGNIYKKIGVKTRHQAIYKIAARELDPKVIAWIEENLGSLPQLKKERLESVKARQKGHFEFLPQGRANV